MTQDTYPELKKEIEFETKLRAFLAEYGYSLRNVINLLDPQARRRAPAVESKTGTRKPRQVKFYKKPHTGEVVDPKSGNHRTLKEWKTECGYDTVESWLTKRFWFECKRVLRGHFRFRSFELSKQEPKRSSKELAVSDI